MERKSLKHLQIIYRDNSGMYHTYLIKNGTLDDFCKSFNLNKTNIVDMMEVEHTFTVDKNCPPEINVNDLM